MKSNKKAKKKVIGSTSKKIRKPDVYAVLKNYGAPFWDRPDSSLTLEEAIVLGLRYSVKKDNALIAGIIPFVLTINAEKRNSRLLLSMLKTDKERQLLGYFADFANKFKTSRKLKSICNTLYSPNYKKLNIIGGRLGKFMKLLIIERDNQTAQRWNILTIDTLDGHFIRYKKWLGQK